VTHCHTGPNRLVGRGHAGFQRWVERSWRVLRSHGGDGASAPRRCRTAAKRRSTTDLGMAAQLNNGHGTGNEHGVLTDDVQAADRGRRRGFSLARCSGAAVLGYRRGGRRRNTVARPTVTRLRSIWRRQGHEAVGAGVERGDAAQGPHQRVKLKEDSDSKEGGAGDPSREAARSRWCLNGSIGRR
jgi:hypothetical protein